MTAPLHDKRPGTSGARLPDTQHGMRRRNLSRVMHAVAAHGPLSRAAVASRIGLTRAAVSTLVEELIRSGLLDELGPERPGRVGRPGSALAVSTRGPVGVGPRSASIISRSVRSTCGEKSVPEPYAGSATVDAHPSRCCGN